VVGVGDEAVGVGDDPGVGWITLGGGGDGGQGDVDSVGLAVGLCGQICQVETVAGADVEEGVGGRGLEGLGDGFQQRPGEAEVVEIAAGGDGGGGVAGIFGAAVLGLEKVDVAGAGDVEGVVVGAGEAGGLAGEGGVTVADSAEELQRF